MFMSPPSGEHWTSMVCMAELQGKKLLFYSKKNIAAVYSLLKTTWISQKVIRKIFCGWMRPKSNFLAWMRSVMFGDEQTLHSSIRTLSHLWNMVVVVSWFGLLCCLWTRTACNHWRNYEFWVVPTHSIGKCQGIRLWTEAQQKVGHAVRQQH